VLQRFVTASTSTWVAVLPWRYDAEMGTASSLHASAEYGEYNERFGFGSSSCKLSRGSLQNPLIHKFAETVLCWCSKSTFYIATWVNLKNFYSNELWFINYMTVKLPLFCHYV